MKLILSSCDFSNDESREVIYQNLPKGVILCHYTYQSKSDFDELCKTSNFKAYYLTDLDSIVYETNI